MRRHSLLAVISLDVEEEGLFCGKYQCREPQVTNLASLGRLMPFIERGIRPTLFCAYPALVSSAGVRILKEMAQFCEIGAHLHFWNTPPIPGNAPPYMDSVPARDLPLDLFAQKLRNVCEAARNVSGEPVRSFRMGRWDLRRNMLPLVRECGLICDASVRPLHWHMDNGSGPDHFGAPADPYWIPTAHGKLLEVPLTVLPLFQCLRQLPPRLLPRLTNWGALALLAVYHPLWLMKLVTRLHARRGGRVISLTWHSSEMMGGCTPHLPDKDAVNRFMDKISAYLCWLEAAYDIKYVFMRELAKLHIFPTRTDPEGDWTWNQ